MTDTNTVATNIKYSIEKNGYPAKTVKLPFKPVYQSCKDHGTALKAVLENLKDERIIGRIEGDYIVFHSPQQQAEPSVDPIVDSTNGSDTGQPSGGGSESWLDMLKRMPGLSNLSNLEGEMQKAMSNLSPEQLRELQARVQNMTPEERQAIMKSLGDLFKPKPGPR
ncbi:hypothetical protein [Nitrospina watsonii]|uniref:Uncharacterized protein n=1 Tax=Nitrospina watsonii TaxID=1323948 RepID=A0ABN8VTD1_9BACT|nr:hypothetical protein [Nitrospina watsonii]CAI2717160.1 conserved protein of unknown function [Nitrospina watsonii]